MKVVGAQLTIWRFVALLVTYTNVYGPFMRLRVYANKVGIFTILTSYILDTVNGASVRKRITLASMAERILLWCIRGVGSATVTSFSCLRARLPRIYISTDVSYACQDFKYLQAVLFRMSQKLSRRESAFIQLAVQNRKR